MAATMMSTRIAARPVVSTRRAAFSPAAPQRISLVSARVVAAKAKVTLKTPDGEQTIEVVSFCKGCPDPAESMETRNCLRLTR